MFFVVRRTFLHLTFKVGILANEFRSIELPWYWPGSFLLILVSLLCISTSLLSLRLLSFWTQPIVLSSLSILYWFLVLSCIYFDISTFFFRSLPRSCESFSFISFKCWFWVLVSVWTTVFSQFCFLKIR